MSETFRSHGPKTRYRLTVRGCFSGAARTRRRNRRPRHPQRNQVNEIAPSERQYEYLLGELVERIAKGECVLFLGSGVHSGPPEGSVPHQKNSYPEHQRPPLGSDLSRRLAKWCDFAQAFPDKDAGELQRVALYGEIRLGRNLLVRELDKTFRKAKTPSPILRALAALDFRVVVTTNYDRLFEKALQDSGRDPAVLVYHHESQPTESFNGEATFDRPFLFKIHGDLERPEDIVITDEDYIDFVMRMGEGERLNPVPVDLLYFLRKWPVLFVGYSLRDYNLRVLFKTLRWRLDPARIPIMYSIDPAPDPLIFDVWHHRRRYVNFITEDAWSFVPTLYRAVRNEEMPL